MKTSNLAARLRRRLRQLGMKPSELAAAAYVRRSNISRYLAGTHRPTHGAVIQRLARALQVSTSWFD